MYKRGYLIVLFLISLSLYAQPGLPDSLEQRVSGMQQDSIYVNTLNDAAFQYLRSNPTIAREICTHVLDVSQRIKFTKGYARALTVMGNTYWYEGVYEFAQNYYLLAARQYQSINDNKGLGETYNNLGEVYKRLGDYDKALEYLTRAIGIINTDPASRGLILYNIGELHIGKDALDTAKKYIDESFAIAMKINDKRLMAFNYWSYGAISLKQKNYQAALSRYFDAEKIWNKAKETRSLIQTYQDIADVYMATKQFSSAQKYLDLALSLAQRVKVADLQVNNYLRYARLDSLRGDYKAALYHLSRHNSLKDSVYNLLKAEQIARLQTIYETERNESENRQLRAERELKDSEIQAQRYTLIAISAGLILSGALAFILHRQRKKILFQKNAIEVQAKALLQLNNDLQELNKTLEARIDERTRQLTIQNKRITEYTFINAHKLRAPVASILGLISLLQQTDLKERDEILVHLKTCAEQLDEIIHKISRDLDEAIIRENP